MIYQPKLPPDTYVRKFNHDTALYVLFRGELVTITTTIGKHHGSDTASSRAQAPHYSLALLWNVKTHAVLPYYGATHVRMCVRKFVWCSRLEASLLRSWPVAPSRAPPESNPGSDLPWLEASPIQTFVLRRQLEPREATPTVPVLSRQLRLLRGNA